MTLEYNTVNKKTFLFKKSIIYFVSKRKTHTKGLSVASPSLSLLRSFQNEYCRTMFTQSYLQIFYIYKNIETISVDKTLILRSIKDKSIFVSVSKEEYKFSYELQNMYTFCKQVKDVETKSYPQNILDNGSIIKNIFRWSLAQNIPADNITKNRILERLFCFNIPRGISSEARFQVLEDLSKETGDIKYKVIAGQLIVEDPKSPSNVGFITELAFGDKYAIYHHNNIPDIKLNHMILLRKLPANSKDSILSQKFTGQACCDAKFIYFNTKTKEHIVILIDFKQKVFDYKTDIQQMYLKIIINNDSNNNNIQLIQDSGVRKQYLIDALRNLKDLAIENKNKNLYEKLLYIEKMENSKLQLAEFNTTIITENKDGEYKTSLYFEEDLVVNKEKYNQIADLIPKNVKDAVNSTLFEDKPILNDNFNNFGKLLVTSMKEQQQSNPDKLKKAAMEDLSGIFDNWKSMQKSESKSAFLPEFVKHTNITDIL